MAPPMARLEALAARSAGSADGQRQALRRIEPTSDELAAHEEYLAALDRESGGRCLWRAQAAAS